MSNSLQPHESQHAGPPCPSPTPGVHSNSRPSSQWCHPAISSSVVPFSSCPQSLPASGSFPMSQLFAWGAHSTGVSASASVLPTNTLAVCISALNKVGLFCLVTKSCLTLLQPHGLCLSRVPSPWYFPGKNTGVGNRSLLQGIFPTQGWNSCFLHWQADSLPLSHQGSP